MLHSNNRPYDLEATNSSIKQDFMPFCLLAARHGVIPPSWDWSAFLKAAANHVCYAFEKSDAKERWGGENVFAAQMGGRSLRCTAEHVYKSSCMDQSTSDEEAQAHADCASPPAAVLDTIGGDEAWRQFLVDLTSKRSGAHVHVGHM